MSKIGRPADPTRKELRALFPDWSERTFARYYKGVKQLRETSIGTMAPDEWRTAAHTRANDAATRPNGSFNVSKFVEVCEAQCAARIAEWSGGE